MFRFDVTEPNEDLIKALLEKHDASREQQLRDYYDGKHAILKRKFEDETKPNNKIVTNLCKYVSDVSVGNFLGTPVSYSSSDETLMEDLQDIFDYNDEQYVNYRLGLSSSIARVAYEILYTTTDSNGELQIRFNELNQDEQNVILVYDRSIEKNLVMAVRYFDSEDVMTDETVTEIYVYTSTMIYHYEKREDKITLVDETEQFFGDVPINVYWNKEENGKGDFEDIITLNDAYNLLESDDINESDYSNDAYLVLRNMVTDEKSVKEMKENRVIELDGDGEATWLIKTINDTWKENIKKRIVQDVHKISGTPDVTDENFMGNASGVAMKYKLVPFENNRAAKERMFKKGLQRRIELICNILNVQGKSYDWRDVAMTFTSNLPVNESEEIEGVVKLIGTNLASLDTLRNKLPFIEDSQREAEKIEEEQQGNVDLDRMMENESVIEEVVRRVMNQSNNEGE